MRRRCARGSRTYNRIDRPAGTRHAHRVLPVIKVLLAQLSFRLLQLPEIVRGDPLAGSEERLSGRLLFKAKRREEGLACRFRSRLELCSRARAPYTVLGCG